MRDEFGDRVATLTMMAIYAGLADQPERAAALDREFIAFATRANRGLPAGTAEYHYEYLLVAAETASWWLPKRPVEFTYPLRVADIGGWLKERPLDRCLSSVRLPPDIRVWEP